MHQTIFPDLSTRPFGFTIEQKMKLAPDAIYLAWTEKMDEWFAAPGTLLMRAEVNSVFFFETVFRLETGSELQRHPHYGRFLRLIPNRLIEITWITGAGGTKGAETVVTIELTPEGNGSKVKLTHQGFLDEESKGQHEDAWGNVLRHLDKKMADDQ